MSYKLLLYYTLALETGDAKCYNILRMFLFLSAILSIVSDILIFL